MFKLFYIATFLFFIIGSNNSAKASIGDTTLTYIDSSITVSEFLINGNKRTKPSIILREVDLLKGGQIALKDTSEFLKKTHDKLFNTKLFNSVALRFVEITNKEYLLMIDVVERWYIFPIPSLVLADRNFSEFLQRQGNGKTRLIYGVDYQDKNFRGRNETFKVLLQTGFYNKYELFYELPYINKKQKTGVKVSFSYSQNKELAYQSHENKLNYLSSDRTLRERYYTGLSYRFRPQYYVAHSVALYYRYNSIADTVVDLNPNYFSTGESQYRFFHFMYNYSYNKTDINYYPLKGAHFNIQLEQLGGVIGDVAITNLFVGYNLYQPLTKKLFWASGFDTKLSKTESQPYFNNLALGYGENYIRGYELYVVDGHSYVMNRNSLKWKIVEVNVDASRKVNVSQFNKIPYTFYLKLYSDWGYVQNNTDFTNNFVNDNLANRILFGYGVGLDVTTFYDIVVRLEYSINGLNERGFFLNWSKAI